MRWYWIVLCVLLAVLGAAGGWFFAAQRARSPEAVHRECLSRLDTLGRALDKYARDNEGRLPPELTDLYPGYIDGARVCESPRSHRSSSPETYRYENRAAAGTGFAVLVVHDPPGTHEAVAMGSHAALMRNARFLGVKTFSDDELQMLVAVQEHGFDYLEDGTQSALQGLLAIMNQSEGMVRDAAAEILSLAPKPQTAKLLVGELAREKVQDQAVRVLTDIGERALPDLIRACDSPDPAVRANAVRSLGDIADESAATTVFSKLTDANPQVRSAAAKALGKMKAARVIPLLTKGLREGDPETQEQIIAAIPDIGESLLPGLGATLERGDTASRQAAAFILGKLKSESVVPVLGRASEDEDWTVAWYAAQALAEIGSEDCVDYLIALLDRPLTDEGTVKLHAAAVNGLGTIGGDRIRDKLREVLARYYEPNQVRSAAADHLGELQDRDAVPVLIEAMTKFYYLRPSAAEALRKITGHDFGTRPELWKKWWESAPQPPPRYGDVYIVPPPPPAGTQR